MPSDGRSNVYDIYARPKKKLWRYSCEMPYKCEGRYEYPKGHAFHPDNKKKRK